MECSTSYAGGSTAVGTRLMVCKGSQLTPARSLCRSTPFRSSRKPPGLWRSAAASTLNKRYGDALSPLATSAHMRATSAMRGAHAASRDAHGRGLGAPLPSRGDGVAGGVARGDPAADGAPPLEVRGWGLRTSVAAVLLSAAATLGANPALATDSAAVGTCLLANCQVELAKCIGDFGCLENLVCLNTCTNRPDETACQIRCGDLYDDTAVQTFNACAVSSRKCVPQRVDKDVFPIPPDCALDTNFDLANFQGRWYITAGLNPLFDTFDCQEHFFGVPDPGQLYAKINWRIDKGDNDFIERSTIQTFNQDQVKPAVLYNHGNEYLHYEDDWYILAQKPDEYVVVYYKGNNDAWLGYGGAVVYTRAASLPKEYIPEISAAVEKAGMKWDDFRVTDNSCGPHPPPSSVIEKVEKGAEKVEKATEEELSELRRFVAKEAREIENTLETDLRSFGKGFTIIEKDILEVLQKDGRGITTELSKDAMLVEEKARSFLEKIEANYKPSTLGIQFPNIFKGFRLPGSS